MKLGIRPAGRWEARASQVLPTGPHKDYTQVNYLHGYTGPATPMPTHMLVSLWRWSNRDTRYGEVLLALAMTDGLADCSSRRKIKHSNTEGTERNQHTVKMSDFNQ